MKLFDQVLIITPALIGLLLFFKSSINHIKTGTLVITKAVIATPEPVSILTAHIGGKGNVSKLVKEQFTEFSMSVKEVPQ